MRYQVGDGIGVVEIFDRYPWSISLRFPVVLDVVAMLLNVGYWKC